MGDTALLFGLGSSFVGSYHDSSLLGLDLDRLDLVLEPALLVGLGPRLLRPNQQ